MTILRDYQRTAVDALFAFFDADGAGNPLVVAPTGSGKSVIIAAFLREALQWPDQRILVVTHVRELVRQNHARLLALWPDAPAGVHSAGLGTRDVRQPIILASVQSIVRRATQIGAVDLVLIDEAHLVPRKGLGQYRQLLTTLRLLNPRLRVIGFTATPYRLDSGSLIDPNDPDALFHTVAYDIPVGDLVRDGYLTALVPKGTAAEIDTAHVGKRGGDFVPGELERAALAGDNVQLAVAEIVRHAAGRSSWLVFACGIDHAEQIADELRQHGVDVATVFGTTPKPDRDRILGEFVAGRLRCVVNVGVLTTGFDAPGTDLIALLRPTVSPGLYVQMCGRGMRNALGKANCLVLDFGGNVRRHGPIDDVQVKRAPGAEGPRAKECPECATFVSIAALACPECGYVWPERERDTKPKHDVEADTRAILQSLRAERVDTAEVPVTRVSYRAHSKAGSPDSLCLTYWHGRDELCREWWCLESSGWPLRRALQLWCRASTTEAAPPIKIADALARQSELQTPERIRISRDGQWLKVVQRFYRSGTRNADHRDTAALG